MILLGIDYGSKRIGLAVGDSTSLMVFPLKSIERGDRNDDQVIAELLEEAKKESVGHIVVGLPKSMRASEKEGKAKSRNESAVQAFIDKLQSKTNLTVDAEDERLSSKAADQKRIMFGISKKNYDRDAAAAAEILQTYVDRHFRRDDVSWLNQ